MKYIPAFLLSLVLLGGGICLSAQEKVSPGSKPTTPSPSTSPITKKTLQDRLAGLEAGRAQALADLQAYEGAIQECQYWIGQFEKAEKEPKEKPKKVEEPKPPEEKKKDGK